MPTTRLYDQSEDAASLALALLMQSEPEVLRVFLRLVAPEALSLKMPWIISPQHRTFLRRRIDIFIRSGNFSVVVEAKVRDGIKAFQFDHYARHVIEHETAREPVLVWLVQRPRSTIGMNAAKAQLITWNDLHRALGSVTTSGVQQFCADLVSCGIVLPRTVTAVKKTHRGYDPDYAVAILRRVLDSVDGLVGGVEENTRTPLALHVRRAAWELHWRTRVWFYFQPLTDAKNAVAPFKFVCHLLLYHSENDLFEPDRIERWSRVMDRQGMTFSRNHPGKWKGSQDPLPVPIRFPSKNGLRYVFGNPAQEVRQQFAFDWCDEQAAVTTGHEFLSWGLHAIDQCLAA